MKKAHNKSPSVVMKQLMKVIRAAAAAVGADVCTPDYRISWLTLVVIFLIIIYYVLSVWTVLFKIEHNLSLMLETFCMAGSVIQGTTKLIGAILRTKEYTSLRFQLEEVYEEYELKGSRYCTALYKSIDRIKRVVSLIIVGYLFCLIGILNLPFTMLAVNGKRYMLMQYHIPGLDVNTDFGYYGTLIIHATAILAAAFGLFAGDNFVLIFTLHSFMFADIFRLKVLELNEFFQKGGSNSHPSVTESLNDLVKWHQGYLNFTDTCNYSFSFIVTVQVATSAVSIVLTIFVLMTGDWPIGYPYLLITVYNLYVYCVLGTKIEDCNDDFCYEIYNINWYDLTVSQQKTVRTMLMKSQSPSIIDIAGVLPLSVSTALQITKTIYSITMLFVQVVD